MSDEQVKGYIRGFIKAMVAGDSKQTAAFLAPDAAWTGPGGTFKGATDIAAYTGRIKNAVKDYRITENGMGIVVQGNTGVIEHNIAGITDGKKWEVPGHMHLRIQERQNPEHQDVLRPTEPSPTGGWWSYSQDSGQFHSQCYGKAAAVG